MNLKSLEQEVQLALKELEDDYKFRKESLRFGGSMAALAFHSAHSDYEKEKSKLTQILEILKS